MEGCKEAVPAGSILSLERSERGRRCAFPVLNTGGNVFLCPAYLKTEERFGQPAGANSCHSGGFGAVFWTRCSGPSSVGGRATEEGAEDKLQRGWDPRSRARTGTARAGLRGTGGAEGHGRAGLGLGARTGLRNTGRAQGHGGQGWAEGHGQA